MDRKLDLSYYAVESQLISKLISSVKRQLVANQMSEIIPFLLHNDVKPENCHLLQMYPNEIHAFMQILTQSHAWTTL